MAVSIQEGWLSLASFRELVQGVEHRFAGNPDQAAKGLVQLQDQENGARDSEGRNHQSKDGGRIGWREHAEAEKDDCEPGDKDDKQRLRNGRDRLRYEQRSNLANICSQGRCLRLEAALRVVVRREILDCAIGYITGLRVGSQARR